MHHGVCSPRATASRCLQPAGNSYAREAVVASGKRVRTGHAGGVHHAAIGHPQPCLGSQARQLRGRAALDRNLADLKLGEGGELLVEPSGAGGPDKHLGEGDGAGSERVALGEDRLGSFRVRVGVVEMRDKNARVKNDQAGHSSRSRSR